MWSTWMLVGSEAELVDAVFTEAEHELSVVNLEASAKRRDKKL